MSSATAAAPTLGIRTKFVVGAPPIYWINRISLSLFKRSECKDQKLGGGGGGIRTYLQLDPSVNMVADLSPIVRNNAILII